MDSCYWCATCTELYEKDVGHSNHDVTHIGGPDLNKSLAALDQMIECGLKFMKNREQDVENAKDVKDDIEALRNQLIEDCKARCDRMVQDVRVSMEYRAGELLKEMNQQVGDMEMRCHSIINTSRVKLDSIKGFIQEAAITLPDEETGSFDSRQLYKLNVFYKTMTRLEKQPQPRVCHVEFNMTHPNSYQRKTACKTLADAVSGTIEKPESEAKQSGGQDVVDGEAGDFVAPLVKPMRRMSRDNLKS